MRYIIIWLHLLGLSSPATIILAQIGKYAFRIAYNTTAAVVEDQKFAALWLQERMLTVGSFSVPIISKGAIGMARAGSKIVWDLIGPAIEKTGAHWDVLKAARLIRQGPTKVPEVLAWFAKNEDKLLKYPMESLYLLKAAVGSGMTDLVDLILSRTSTMFKSHLGLLRLYASLLVDQRFPVHYFRDAVGPHALELGEGWWLSEYFSKIVLFQSRPFAQYMKLFFEFFPEENAVVRRIVVPQKVNWLSQHIAENAAHVENYRLFYIFAHPDEQKYREQYNPSITREWLKSAEFYLHLSDFMVKLRSPNSPDQRRACKEVIRWLGKLLGANPRQRLLRLIDVDSSLMLNLVLNLNSAESLMASMIDFAMDKCAPKSFFTLWNAQKSPKNILTVYPDDCRSIQTTVAILNTLSTLPGYKAPSRCQQVATSQNVLILPPQMSPWLDAVNLQNKTEFILALMHSLFDIDLPEYMIDGSKSVFDNILHALQNYCAAERMWPASRLAIENEFSGATLGWHVFPRSRAGTQGTIEKVMPVDETIHLHQVKKIIAAARLRNKTSFKENIREWLKQNPSGTAIANLALMLVKLGVPRPFIDIACAAIDKELGDTLLSRRISDIFAAQPSSIINQVAVCA